MQTQDKYMKTSWLYTSGGGIRSKFTSAKNRIVCGKYLNTPTTSALAKALKTNKSIKV